MDVIAMIDKLDELVQTSRSVPMTDMAMLDRQKVFAVLDEMRQSIPDEIKQARWVVKTRQETLEEAEREAERIKKEAEAKAERMASETEVMRIAEANAEQALNAARDEASKIKSDSLDYADRIFAHLEVSINKTLQAVEKTRETLQTTGGPSADI